MEDILRDYGFKPQGKSVPMAANKTANSTPPNFNFNFSANNTKSSPLNDVFSTNPGRNTYSSGDFNSYDDVFGGPPQYKAHASQSSGYDDIFQSFPSSAPTAPPIPSSAPVYDAPRYDDDDIFGGVPGVKSSTTVAYDDVFSVGSVTAGASNIEDLLGGFRSSETGNKARAPTPPPPPVAAQGHPGAFDDLLPGFGNTEPPKPRVTTDTKPHQSTDSTQKPANDPFVVLEADSFSSNGSSATFHDPLEDFGIPTDSAGINDRKGSSNGTVEINDIFDGFPQSVPSVSPPVDDFGKGRSPLKASQSSSPPQTNNSRESVESKSPKKAFVNNLEKNHPKIYSDAPVTDFDLPSGVADGSTESTLNRNKDSFHEDSTFPNNNFEDTSPPGRAEKGTEVVDDKWITVDDVQLFTQPTSAPPPSRPAPPLVIKQGPSSKKNSDFMSVAHSTAFNIDKPSVISSIDELEEFAMSGSSGYAQYEEDADNNSTAAASVAAMKEAMDRAEAKIKMAKKVREREKEAVERASEEAMDDEEKERLARAAQEIHEREEREREEREKEKLRIEREREKEREREREREKQRIAVERATREARERAAAEAREKAQRAAVERATKEARERAAAEARERAEREARERVEREAREREARVRAERAAAERAAAEARERAEKAAVERAAAEARERAAAEGRERAAAERAAVDRAAAEVRLRAQRAAVERATAEVRGRAAERASAERAAAAKERPTRNDNDLESFFSMGARPNSAPRQRPPDAAFNTQSQNKGFSSEGPQRTSAGVPSGVRKSSSAANIIDDWTSIFTAPSADEFQEVEGETAERRKARLERHQRTRERTAKALAEKNERDMQAQREQAERHRMAETLDLEIKRWATGKEGNLRALLSTLQHVLWPEAGWQPVGLTDVITAASVKKVYRKATLCVHPDKVQQKGATTQQKYIAEKVFDLLKEAWNKFNSEELF